MKIFILKSKTAGSPEHMAFREASKKSSQEWLRIYAPAAPIVCENCGYDDFALDYPNMPKCKKCGLARIPKVPVTVSPAPSEGLTDYDKGEMALESNNPLTEAVAVEPLAEFAQTKGCYLGPQWETWHIIKTQEHLSYWTIEIIKEDGTWTECVTASTYAKAESKARAYLNGLPDKGERK
jgi:predicted Zn-ribbon and HTH transcriptional regulator